MQPYPPKEWADICSARLYQRKEEEPLLFSRHVTDRKRYDSVRQHVVSAPWYTAIGNMWDVLDIEHKDH